MNKNIRIAFLLCVAIATIFLTACGDSVEADGQAVAEVDESSSSKAKASSSSVKSSSSKANSSSSSVRSSSSKASSSSSSAESSSSKALYPESFRPDDAEYPYAGIPRIVIETEKRQEIKDRETEIPAKLQIWGEKEAESEIMDLTIRGRGNSSWKMPKKSYKIEFEKKQSMLGMPKDKDWALIANYADKTLMKNYLMYQLSADLGAYYAPRCEFAEFYLNGEYLGVYLITETIKIGSDRINVSKENSFIVEFDEKYRNGEQVFFSERITGVGFEKPYRVHNPKDATEDELLILENYIKTFEDSLKEFSSQKDNNVTQWIDVDEYLKHYWVQEFSKNPDSRFYSSVYFSWTVGGVIKMGPVWDFDIAFGGQNDQKTDHPEDWHTRERYWNIYIFRDAFLQDERNNFWIDNKSLFSGTLNKIDSIRIVLQNAANNNFKKWNILQSTEYAYHGHSYYSYKDAAEELKTWILQRMAWIDSQIVSN